MIERILGVLVVGVLAAGCIGQADPEPDDTTESIGSVEQADTAKDLGGTWVGRMQYVGPPAVPNASEYSHDAVLHIGCDLTEGSVEWIYGDPINETCAATLARVDMTEDTLTFEETPQGICLAGDVTVQALKDVAGVEVTWKSHGAPPSNAQTSVGYLKRIAACP